MPDKNLLITPGEILKEEFLDPMNVTAYRLAMETHMPQSRISEIISGSRRITADTALRFAKYFNTSPEFWMNLQTRYDLDSVRFSDAITSIEMIQPVAI